MKTEILKISGLLIGLIFVFSLFPLASAAVVWSDNFDDGNYDDWNVTVGDWRVTDGILETYYVDSYETGIWHDSSQIEGTWSFDVYHGSSSSAHESVCMFMANGTDTPTDYYGYGIRFSVNSIFLVKQTGSFLSLSSLAFVMIEGLVTTWTHIDVTRNSAGEFNVYFNATSTIAEPDITVVHTEYSYSERFVVATAGILLKLDNVIVDDTILITPPTTTTTTTTNTTTTTTNGGTTPLPIDTTLLIAGAGVVGVIIIAVVVLKRR